jgi:CIC family chloride channel protein
MARRLLWQLLAPALVGALTGVCVAGVTVVVEERLLSGLATLPGLIPALFSPLALLLTFAVGRYITKTFVPATAELYILTYHAPHGRLPLRELPGRLLAAAATVGLGGSQGFESPSALIGASWGQTLARLTPSEDTRRTLLAAGASAGIAAVFSSPAMGALYGIEVPYRRDVDAPRLAPCAIAAVAAYLVRDQLIGVRLLIPVFELPSLDATYVGACALVAVLCGLGAHLFAVVEGGLRAIGRRQTRLRRALIGGAALGVLAVAGFQLAGRWITFGPGYVAADWLFAGTHSLGLIGVVLAVRAAGNLICVYGGGGGGVFTSLACNGAFIGQLVAESIGRGHSHLLALLGAACFLGAGYRLPIASMLWVGEQSGSVAISIAGLGAIAVAQLLMGDESVSEAKVEER